MKHWNEVHSKYERSFLPNTYSVIDRTYRETKLVCAIDKNDKYCLLSILNSISSVKIQMCHMWKKFKDEIDLADTIVLNIRAKMLILNNINKYGGSFFIPLGMHKIYANMIN